MDVSNYQIECLRTDFWQERYLLFPIRHAISMRFFVVSNFIRTIQRPGGNVSSRGSCRSWNLSCWVRSFCGKRPRKERFTRKLLWICLDDCCTLDVFHLPDFSSLHIGWCALSQICWPTWPNQRPVSDGSVSKQLDTSPFSWSSPSQLPSQQQWLWTHDWQNTWPSVPL